MKLIAFQILNTLRFAWAFWVARPMTALLNTLLLGLGLGSISFLLLVSAQLQQAFERDLAGIDVVVGAKGSPLQLILSGVFHLDVPTGNVPLQAVDGLRAHPQVAQVIPLSLGDSFQGFRIVGTTLEYPRHYQATLSAGQWWSQPMQAVLGAQVAAKTGLKVGDRFVGSHGLGGSGEQHGATPFVVVGILAPGGTVLDRLVLCATESIWHLHEKSIAQDEADRKALQEERELTLALIRYQTPLAAVSFPRFVNSTTTMQAAAPALEITRLLRMLGLGLDVLRALAAALLLTAALSVMIALWNAVRERRQDLALLRMLGARPLKVASLLLCEAFWLGVAGTALGLLVGQCLMAALAWMLQLDSSVLLRPWQWPVVLAWVPVLALFVAGLSAALPVVKAYRVSLLELLH
jgi:putative ABC transport system permease protein